jgi:hypothetical protein
VKKIDDDDKKTNRIQLLQKVVNQNEKLRELAIFLYENKIDWNYIEDIVLLLHKDKVEFTRRSAVQQLEWMFTKMKTEPISNFVVYFVNGIKDKSSTDKAINKFDNDQAAFWEAKMNLVKKDFQEREAMHGDYQQSINFYNWITEGVERKPKNTNSINNNDDIPY